MIHFVQLDVGGYVSFTLKGADLPHNAARWDSTPTCALYHSNGGLILSAVSVSVGLSTSLSTAATAGTKTLQPATLSGLQRWDDYIVGPNTNGQHESIVLEMVGASSIQTLAPLKYTYAANDPLKDHKMSLWISSTYCASVEKNCRAEWCFAIGGKSYKRSTFFHVSRYVPSLTIGEDDIDIIVPRARSLISSDQRIALILRDLWNRVILSDISVLMNPGAIGSGEAIDQAVIYRFQMYLSSLSKNKDEADYYERQYKEQLDHVRESFIDLDESGGQEEGEVPDSMTSRTLLRC